MLWSVRTDVRIVLYYDQSVGRTLHSARVVVPMYVSSFFTIRPWSVHSTVYVLWSVPTYLSSFITTRPWGVHSSWHVLWSVRMYHPLVRSDRGGYVRTVLYYDQTVGRTYVSSFIMIRPLGVHCMHSARIVVRTYHLYYDQTVGCTLHSAPVVVPAYVGLLRSCHRDAL